MSILCKKTGQFEFAVRMNKTIFCSFPAIANYWSSIKRF